MRRARRTGVVATILATAFATVACGGSEVATPLTPEATPTAAAAPTTTAVPSVSVPADLALPADVSIVFDGTATAPAGTEATLRDWRLGQRAYVAAAAKADPRFPPLLRYQAGEALVAAVQTIRLKQQRKRTVIGVRRVYAVTVSAADADSASLTWCLDDTKFFSRDRNTNTAIVVHGPSDHYRFSGYLQLDPKLKNWVLVRSVGQEGVQC